MLILFLLLISIQKYKSPYAQTTNIFSLSTVEIIHHEI